MGRVPIVLCLPPEIKVGFEMSEYYFNESAGSLPNSVYIVRENLVTVSSNFDVTIVVQATSTASGNGKVNAEICGRSFL